MNDERLDHLQVTDRPLTGEYVLRYSVLDYDLQHSKLSPSTARGALNSNLFSETSEMSLKNTTFSTSDLL